ncbi:DNA-directed RNA polymerase I subunit RPA1 [Eupeodes corollae]|uniref:DNA-directed RNA polymerase I subunit RPA1 n=1 Tax=Eupeodes corollae TaxID=290404 RepID=UPI002490625F|nr:DNA-directed RNA polymerase I subunit RPA1 [Eupeodes corollae]
MATESRDHIDMIPSNLEFRVFTGEEIKKLSVVKIITGLTFDSLGHPYPGGLYDNAMGIHGKSLDTCLTCRSNVMCPGHLGHIELNALVYNPFFIKLAHDILRMFCIHCFSIQMPNNAIEILILQLQLVDAGFVIEAQEMEIYKSEYVCQNSDEFVKGENGERTHPRIAQLRELIAKSTKNTCNNTKTSCGIRSAIIHSAMQCRTTKKCSYCSKAMRLIKYSYGKLVIYVTKSDLEISRSQGDQVIKGGTNKVVLADECRQYLREINKRYSTLLKLLFPIFKSASELEHPVDILFMNIIPVTPPRSRPTNFVNNHIIEHTQTTLYKKIVETNAVLRAIMIKIKSDKEDLQNEVVAVYEAARGSTPLEKMYFAWQALQAAVDLLLDSNLSPGSDESDGLKQILEKKEGLIRKHMMGKRVNFAARTVITPDPNINVEEIGIPDIFARKLSFPVPVTPWNVAELRKLVMNGPEKYPGANFIEDENGFTFLIPANNASKRESYAKLLLNNSTRGTKIVHRHVLNGDMLLLNRQPSLHKPSIMAHKARVLRGEKTFRLHYSNCKAYNADFDGDEMNAHLAQSQVSRSEAQFIANVASNYLVPKDGTPLGGLIQDHVISGVKLSIRGRFFNKEDYQQLVFQGLSHLQGNIKLLPPTILKPTVLWSGKQILSTIIINIIPKGYDPINLISTAKINEKNWISSEPRVCEAGGKLLGAEMAEYRVTIRKGELLTGVLDKKHYGAAPYSLVHSMYELYGGEVSTCLLTSFTKVFTSFLQREGFTLGVHDILVTANADAQRRQIVKDSRKIGNAAVASALDLEPDTPHDVLAAKMEEAYIQNPKFRVILDRKYKSLLDEFTNKINKVCLPEGLISRFPENNLQLMVLSGAKGSTVNTMQISCLLGQIELEGKRPPLMISGKSLPSFTSYETSPKSGGFIDGRFMTGIQPQDFFFHCMAGREGLIDTAVKTSRSGYLQRCLIKHLEGLTVHYDLTVRDSDNSVVQFLYGEDGMDILKSRFFKDKCATFLDYNSSIILRPSELKSIKDDVALVPVQKHAKKIRTWKKKNTTKKRPVSSFAQFSKELRNEVVVENPNELNKETGRLKIDEAMITLWNKADAEAREKYKKKYSSCPDPTISKYKPDNFYGSVSEYVEKLIEDYSTQKPHRKDIITDIMYIKSIKSLAEPGEPVGLLAAQSIGEPSTQMTLNTFHFAGRGEMNVTLGIPRLREILMLASAAIKTPSMDIPVFESQAKAADKLRIKLNRVTLADVLQFVNVKISLVLFPERAYRYKITFQFLPREAYQDDFIVKPKKILKYMTETFFKQFFRSILKSSKKKETVIDIDDDKAKKSSKSDKFEEVDYDDEGASSNQPKKSKAKPMDEDSDDDDDNNNDDDDATGIKLKNRKHDDNEYDDPDDVEEIEDANEVESIRADEEEEEKAEEKGEEEPNEDDEVAKVLTNEMVRGYVYDKANHLWCKLTFDLPVRYRKPDISTIIRELAQKAVIYQVPKIKRAILYKNNEELLLKTDGINIVEMFKYNKILDVNRIYSNDIHGIANTYGIEAAAKVIVKEVQNVFKVYGITVDPRHLLLIADYMTFEGTFRPLSRKGMEHSSSPLQQMSFESCLQFLKSATISGRADEFNSPSSRLMVGLPVKNGTGCFDLRFKYNDLNKTINI